MRKSDPGTGGAGRGPRGRYPRRAWTRSRRRWRRRSVADSGLLATTARLPARGRRQAVPPDARAAGRLLRRPDRPAADPRLGRDRAGAPGDALPRRRDRRGRHRAAASPSANARWDNTVAILTGDFLFARASELSADLGHRRVPAARPHDRDPVRRPDPRGGRAPATSNRPRATTWRSSGARPASLIATSCRLGGMLSDATPERHSRSWRSSASRSGWPSSSPTTSWTSPRPSSSWARSRAPTSARASTPLPVLHALRDGARPRGAAADPRARRRPTASSWIERSRSSAAAASIEHARAGRHGGGRAGDRAGAAAAGGPCAARAGAVGAVPGGALRRGGRAP